MLIVFITILELFLYFCYMIDTSLKIGDRTFYSRLFLGTGKFSSAIVMKEAIISSQTEMVTMAMRRINPANYKEDSILSSIDTTSIQLLPNTSGVRNAKEAVFSAELAREALQTNWIKLEIHPDPKYLMPDPIETLEAAKQLVQRGFIVLPYCHADPVLCKRLEEVGTSAVMPLGSPIGSNQGLLMRSMIEIIIAQSNIPVIVDAGIGAPSHAALAMELGADAVLVNTAIAIAENPTQMAKAFSMAIEAGRIAFISKLPKIDNIANASSPFTKFLENEIDE